MAEAAWKLRDFVSDVRIADRRMSLERLEAVQALDNAIRKVRKLGVYDVAGSGTPLVSDVALVGLLQDSAAALDSTIAKFQANGGHRS